jgi:nicotinate dehydrogenase subunit B
VVADAALLSRAVRRPVRVQLTREQENLWEPKGAAQVMQVDGGLAADGSVAAYDFTTRYPSNAAPTLALLLTGAVPPVAVVSEMGDRTAIPPYAFEHLRVVVHDVAPIVRASWLRGVSALPNSFAHDCYIDELAAQARVDPVQFRLRYLKDDRAADLVRAVAERAGWQSHTEPRREAIGSSKRRGVGFA